MTSSLKVILGVCEIFRWSVVNELECGGSLFGEGANSSELIGCSRASVAVSNCNGGLS